MIEAKDVIALVVIIGLFVLVALDKLSWEAALPVVSAILFWYFGFKVGVMVKGSHTY